MQLVKWNPWRNMSLFNNRLQRFFDDDFLPEAWLREESGLTGWKPAVDVYEDDDKLVIKAELPGVDKKDISVDLNDGVLTLAGTRSYENEVKEEHYYHRERAYGKFHRSFTLPAGHDPEKIKADFKDGLLRIEVPKPEEKKPKKISVH